MARPAGQHGDRQMAKGSCLDDKGRKNKIREKTRTLSSKSWGTPYAACHSPAGEGSGSRTRGQEEAFKPGHPACDQEASWGGCHWAGCWKQDVVSRPLQMPGSALKNWASANRKPFRPCSRQGFHGNLVVLPPPFLPLAAPHPFSSWTKFSIWSLWVKYRLDERCWEGEGGGYLKSCCV